MSNEKVIAQRQQALMATYGAPTLALASGSGAYVWDEDGNKYLDLLAGIAVNALGHAHPAIVAAVTEQIGTLAHTSNLYASKRNVELAERLLDLFGEAGGNGRVFFCNSGAEANEAAFKIARLTGRPNIVAAEKSFHGRTMGALALTGQPSKQDSFKPLPAGVTTVPFGDVEALRDAVDENTAAVFLEPILGESGVVVPPADYLKTARKITTNAGALLVMDEVQTGIGRTGTWFNFQTENIEPDVVTLAKGLGGGLPIGACIAFGGAADLMTPGQHGTTFGGNAVACAAALAVLDTIVSDDLLTNALSQGNKLQLGITALNHPLVASTRGGGLLIGVVLNEDKAPQVQAAAQAHGFLVNATGPDVIRLAPPLILTDAQVDDFLTALPNILNDATEAK